MNFFRNNAAKIALIAIIGSSIALPLIASAQTSGSVSLWPTGFWGPLVSCTGNYLPNSGATPCTSLCDLINTVIRVIYFIMSVAVFIIAPISVLIGGVMIMLSGANPEMLGRGKKVLTGAVIGVVIVLCAYLLVFTAVKVLGVTSIGGFGGPTCTPD